MQRVSSSLSWFLSLRSRSKHSCLLLQLQFPSDISASLRNPNARMEVGWLGQYCNNYFTRIGTVQSGNSTYSTMVQTQMSNQCSPSAMTLSEVQYDNQAMHSSNNAGGVHKHYIGENVSRKDKIKFLTDILLDLKDSKEDVYGALDAWVAWEQSFPIASLKRALITLEKEQQWHRVVQVIKWILSKGQGTTMGTYGQLIRALDMDQRTEEAHKFWVKKIGNDLHSVPWQLCKIMISIYYRNNMPDRLVKLFKGLESFDRKPPEKSIVQKVANAYEMLGLPEEQKRVLEKYNDLFIETWKGHPKRSTKASRKKVEKSGDTGTSDDHKNTRDDAQAS